MDNLNFRQASRDRDKHVEVLEALNNDFVKIMKTDGVGGLKARPRFELKAGALIREEVDNALAYMDPIPLLFQRREAELGDEVEFEDVINTMRVVRYSPGSHPSVFTPLKRKYGITTGMHELAFGIDLIKVLNGQHDISTSVQHAAEAQARHRLELGLGAIVTACEVGAPTDINGNALYDTVADSDIQEADLKAALRNLRAVGEGQVRIFGTGWALDPIMDMTGAKAENLNEELARRGVLGFYRGAQLVEINSDFNPFYGGFPQINGKDLDSLIVLTVDQPGGIFMERDISALDWQETDTEKATFRTGSRMDHGTLVHEAWKYRVLEMTG